jgi:hypothetical protein
MEIEDIPAEAEGSFQKLCAQHGATCNKATQDKHGWDYFVQFRAPPQDSVFATPPDMLPEANKCFAQIKSIRGKANRVRLKLSNAREFATSRTPCFLVVFYYTSGPEADCAFVLHFWENEIASVLKRVRQLNAQGRSDFHRVSMHFPLSRMRRVATGDVLTTIEAMMHAHGASYADKKYELTQTVGFDDHSWIGKVTICAPMEDIVDMSIGLKDTLPATSISLHSVRFGIRAGTATIDDMPGRVSLQSRPQKCTLIIGAEPQGHEVSLPCALIAPAIPGLSKDQFRFRVVHPHLELTCYPGGRARIHTMGTGDERQTLAEMATLLDLFLVLESAHLRFVLRKDGRRILDRTGTLESRRLSPGMRAIATFVRFLCARTQPHELPDDFRLSLADLTAQVASIREFNSMAMSPSVKGSLSIDLDTELPAFSGAAFYAPCVQVPGYSIYGIVKRDITTQPARNGETQFELGKIQHIDIRILAGTLNDTEDAVDHEVDQAFSKLHSGVILPRHRFPTALPPLLPA